MVLDPIPQSLPVHFFRSRPQPPTSLAHREHETWIFYILRFRLAWCSLHFISLTMTAVAPEKNCLEIPVKLYSGRKFSTQNAASLKSSKSRDSNSSVQIQIESNSQFEIVPQDIEELRARKRTLSEQKRTEFSHRFAGPGQMSLVPRAGMCDSAWRSRRY